MNIFWFLLRFSLLFAGCAFLYSFSSNSFADPSDQNSPEKITIWQRNFEDPFLKASVVDYLNATIVESGEYQLVSSEKMEQSKAFEQLALGNIDIVIASINMQRETDFLPVLVPLDRGLAGFRICLVHQQAESFENALSAGSAVNNSLVIGVGNQWPDKAIYEQNDFKTVGHDEYLALFDMLENKAFDCFSRSMQEVDAELEMLGDRPIKKDDELVFIYPNGAFIFVNKDNNALHQRLSRGANFSIESRRYFELFDKHYLDILNANDFYFRKLVVMKNRDLSPQALDSISQYGLASFTFQQMNKQ